MKGTPNLHKQSDGVREGGIMSAARSRWGGFMGTCQCICTGFCPRKGPTLLVEESVVTVLKFLVILPLPAFPK